MTAEAVTENASVAQMADTPTEEEQTEPINVAVPPTFQLF